LGLVLHTRCGLGHYPLNYSQSTPGNPMVESEGNMALVQHQPIA